MSRNARQTAQHQRRSFDPHWKRALAAVLIVAVSAQPLLAQTGEVTEYYATDALGSVRVVFATNGAVLARNDYVPFGDSFNPTGALPSEQFTGQARDGEAALDYFGARFYQSRHGRFTTVDPASPNGESLQEPQRWNRYAYAGNAPVTYVDPDGRWFFGLVFIGVIGSLFGAASYANAPKPGQQTYPSSNPGSLILGVIGAILGAGAVKGTGTAAKVIVGQAVARYGPQVQQAGQRIGQQESHDRARQGEVWALNGLERGRLIHAALGENLPRNFPVIDKFVDGVVTSIKSIDLAAARYQNANALSRQLNAYVDRLAEFTGGSWAGHTVTGPFQRELEIVLRGGMMSPEFQQVFDAAAARANGLGVALKLTTYP